MYNISDVEDDLLSSCQNTVSSRSTKLTSGVVTLSDDENDQENMRDSQ